MLEFVYSYELLHGKGNMLFAMAMSKSEGMESEHNDPSYQSVFGRKWC